MSVVVFGSINIDAVSKVATLPRPGETVSALAFDYHPGGKGANQAVAAARFGAATRMIGATGDDEHGRTMRAFLGGNGIGLDDVATLDGPTGLAQISVAASGENQIVVVGGANARVAARPAALTGGGVFLTQLELPPAEVGIMLKAARAAGMPTMLNTAPALPEAVGLLDDVDILVLNETELAFYLGATLPDEADAIAHAARRLRRRAGQRIVVTLGAAGMVALDGERIVRLTAPKVKAVDTVGAGDCFCGVLAAALSEGAGFDAALASAGSAASLSVQRVGAASSMPTRAEIEAALA